MTALDFYEQEKNNIKVEASDDASITYKRLMVKFANMYHLEQLRLHSVVSSLPTNKEIYIQAENYAYKTFKNFKGRDQVLMKRAYQRGCYWMRKKINK